MGVGISAQLEQDLKSRGIREVRGRIPQDCGDGMIVWYDQMEPLMVVDERIDDLRSLNEIRAHELMHYDREDGNLLEMPGMLADYCESGAHRDTLKYCVSLDRLAGAYIAGCREIWEFAEMLEVSDKTFEDAIRLMQNVYGTEPVVYGKWVFTFAPLKIRRRHSVSHARGASGVRTQASSF